MSAASAGNGARTFDVIVVGVGSMGASACYQLARRGARVLGLEQFDIPHARGSHHGFSRMIRLAYFEHPDYVALLKRAYELWDELEVASDQKLLHVTGGLYIGRPDSELVTGSIDAAVKYDLPHEVLDHAALAARYPQFHVPDDAIAFFETRAGFLIPEKVVAASAMLAMQHGAELHGNEPVVDWAADGSGVTVRTAAGEYRAEQLIVSGGAWSARLLRDLGVDLKVTRQALGWFWPQRPEQFALGRFPVWALDLTPRQQFRGVHYGFPMMADNPGLKIALHWPTPDAVDPDKFVRDPLPGDEADLRAALQAHLPDADGPLVAIRACLYTNSPDSHFIIDRHRGHDRVIIACGFSGHGFKFASVVGEVLADLALTGATANPIGFLGLGRFDL